MNSLLNQPLDALPDPLPMRPIEVPPGGSPFDVTIVPPGSKSLTNRALLLAGLADGESTIRGALTEADDAKRMLVALQQLGAGVQVEDRTLVRIRGVGGHWHPTGESRDVELNLGNAGTATRFLAAAACFSPRPVVIDGNDRMRDRPLGSLTDALPLLGMTVEHLGRVGYPPVRLHPALSGPPPEAMIELGKTASSQFISALLLCGPWLTSGLTMTLNETITSRSYIEMTVGLLDRLGASVRLAEDLRVIRVGPCEHRADRGRIGIDPFDYAVEPDASGATYFWAAAGLITGARCRVRGVGRDSLQGDADFPEVLARMGITLLEHTDDDGTFETRGPRSLTGVLADMSDMPDAVMTLAVCCAFATTPSVIRGVRTLRVKETDRIAALQAELAKIDVKVEVAADSDTITVTPPPNGVECSGRAMPVEFETYDDHRMAMSLALVGLRRPNVYIRNPGCVAKTYPGYWRDLGKLYATE